MSWSAFVVPLHACPADVLDWVREFDPTAVPEELPEPRPLPTVEQVLMSLRSTGCHWDAWYKIVGEGSAILPDRPESPSWDHYLGEVSITVEGSAERSAPVRLHDQVSGLSFRKPGEEGLLRAVTALVALGGPQLVFDTLGSGLVVGPDDSEEALAEKWLW